MATFTPPGASGAGRLTGDFTAAETKRRDLGCVLAHALRDSTHCDTARGATSVVSDGWWDWTSVA